MVDDMRVDFDASDDIEIVKQNLLDDVINATEQAKQRKADDKTRDAQLQAKGRDRTIMFIIIGAALIIILAIAYWATFKRGSAPENISNGPNQTRPVQPPNYRPAPVYQPNRPVAPPSEPVRRTPTDTYEEGPRGGM